MTEDAAINELATGLVDLPEIGLTGSLQEAIDHAVAAGEPVLIGDFGALVRRPAGYVNEIVDVRAWEHIAHHVRHTQPLVGVDSFARYVNLHVQPSTRVYLTDVYGSGVKMLTHDTTAALAVIDDHADGNEPGQRGHHVGLTLRPTSAARRWGTALLGNVNQEQFLTLVVDGIAEIADPDGAVLRDLVSDLHAIRTTSAQSVIRTGGQGRIELAENVKLSAGTGSKVEFPETITVVLTPFAGIPDVITLTVYVTPTVTGDGKVVFKLAAPGVEDELAKVVGQIAVEINERTSINPLWVP